MKNKKNKIIIILIALVVAITGIGIAVATHKSTKPTDIESEASETDAMAEGETTEEVEFAEGATENVAEANAGTEGDMAEGTAGEDVSATTEEAKPSNNPSNNTTTTTSNNTSNNTTAPTTQAPATTAPTTQATAPTTEAPKPQTTEASNPGTTANQNTNTGNTTAGNTNNAHEHRWIAQYTTVHHDAVTHTEKVVDQEAWDEPIKEARWVCGGCYAEFNPTTTSKMDFSTHCTYCQGGSNSWVSYVTVGYTHHEATYKTITVVDKEAYDESVVSGYTCSGCGATK